MTNNLHYHSITPLQSESIARKRKEERNSNWFNAWMQYKRKELRDQKQKEKQKRAILQESNCKTHEENVKLKNAYRKFVRLCTDTK